MLLFLLEVEKLRMVLYCFSPHESYNFCAEMSSVTVVDYRMSSGLKALDFIGLPSLFPT